MGKLGTQTTPIEQIFVNQIAALSSGRIRYYDHNFTWPAGVGSSVLLTVNIAHNVGRPPDMICVFYKSSAGWMLHYDLDQLPGPYVFGYNTVDTVTVDENTNQVINFYPNQYGASGDGLVRMFWFTDDDIETAVDGLKTGGLGTTLITGSEYDTGKTLDGDIIYGKVVDFGALPNSTTKDVAHGISSLGTVLDWRLIADNGTIQVPLSHASGNDPRINISDTNLEIITTSNWSSFNGIAILEYTKV